MIRDVAPSDEPAASTFRRKRLARVALVAFVLTFALARVLVLLIMSRRVPDLYLHVGGTHVHHLNYGIFLLCGVGGYLLLARPGDGGLRIAATAYGVGLGLTFDEFGMWVHLGGPYWQRASYDAVVVVAAVLAMLALAPSPRRLAPRGWAAAAAVVVVLGVFAALLAESLRYADQRVGPSLRQLEQAGPG
jgi:hypothetical protein